MHQAPETATTGVRRPSSAHVHAAAASAAQRSVSNVRKLHTEIRLISCLGRSAPTEETAGQCHLTSNCVYHWENRAHYKVWCLGKPRWAAETLRSLVLQLREEGWSMKYSDHIIWTLLFQVPCFMYPCSFRSMGRYSVMAPVPLSFRLNLLVRTLPT